jgi:hypothetical protein
MLLAVKYNDKFIITDEENVGGMTLVRDGRWVQVNDVIYPLYEAVNGDMEKLRRLVLSSSWHYIEPRTMRGMKHGK